ncbi:MAG: hypothetical protein ACE5HS_11075 [bacterium]
MAETIDDLTITYEEDGVEIVRELDKVVLSKGAWTTIIFKYQDWNAQGKSYSDDKYTIRRYRKMQGVYRQQSKFNISSAAQARKIVEVLQKWTDEKNAGD